MTVVLILLATALVFVLATLVATLAAVLARRDGSTIVAAVKTAAVVFATTLTLACAITAAMTSVLR
ncbi:MULTISPECIES: hypothetical protein [Streptomyces]|uniref:hypothetical protein n=1 Tax=Streptomyces TaxID=1883 RepID=UPI00087898EF|nr:hypothetical protein [Streptomyces olivaceus]AOW90870.1 hypothetical protein BC342_34995 [Streptomyces olivaceus]MBZ6135505.1 hypothetical protein [Streptomyces olivaceus]